MNDQSRGIIVSVNDCKENDAIINVISETYGKIALYVRGYKKITSKNAYACQLFDWSTFLFDYNETRQIQVLKSATLNSEFYKIKADYNKTIMACLICELISASTGEEYDYLMQTMQYLNDSDQPWMILNLFLVKFLNDNGIAPYVDGCTLCDDTEHIETISIEDGGFVCSACNRTLHLEKMNVNLLHQFRVINKASYAVMDKLVGYNNSALTKLLLSILTTYSGVRLKSLAALEKII